MFCPKCKAEYREGFIKCADCGIDLVPELPPEPREEYVDLVSIRTYSDKNEAELARGFLRSNGVNAVLSADDCAGFYPSLSLLVGIRLLVDKKDVETAESILGQEDTSEDIAIEGATERDSISASSNGSAPKDSQLEGSSWSQNGNLFLNLILPILFGCLTLWTLMSIGMSFSGSNDEVSPSFWQAVAYAVAVLSIIGAHALGHYALCRLNEVKVCSPYFIPHLGLGTAGAYVKIRWPVSDRKTLIRIFAAGPIAGFITSWIVLIIGLNFSRITEHGLTGSYLMDSVVTYITTLAVFGNLPDTKDVMLHPVAFAGWIGLSYNACHLLPIGKFDGGRLVYALWGYTVTRWTSYISIGVLLIVEYLLYGWQGLSDMSVLWVIMVICATRFRRQYPAEKYDNGPLGKPLVVLLCIVAGILVVSLPVLTK
jgi:hypothetical protein